MAATDLLSVERLPAPIVRWVEGFESDSDSVNARVVFSDGFRTVIQLSANNSDLVSETSFGRIYTDDEGRNFFIWPVAPEEDESLYGVKDYVASGTRLDRQREALEDSARVVEALGVKLWIWRILCAMAVFAALVK